MKRVFYTLAIGGFFVVFNTLLPLVPTHGAAIGEAALENKGVAELNNPPWSANVQVNDDVGNHNQQSPAIALDTVGNAYAVWSDSRGFNYDIYFTYRTVTGTWEANVMVNDDSANDQTWPDIAVDAAGNAHAAWVDFRAGGQCRIYYAFRPPHGTWSANQRVDDNSCASAPAIAADGAGNVTIVWADGHDNGSHLYAATHPVGGQWGPSIKVDDSTVINTVVSSPDIAVDSAGNAYVVWSDRRADWNNLRDIYFAYRPVVTTTWGANVKVNDVWGDWGDMYPSIAVDSTGVAYVIWANDQRNGRNDIYSAYRSITGIWSANTRVTDGTGYFDRMYSKIAVDGAGNAVATWSDNRNANYDIYFAYRIKGGEWSSNALINDDSGSAMQYLSDIAVMDDGTAHSIWTDHRGSSDDIFSADWSPAVNYPPGNIGISGPITVVPGYTYVFSATVDPITTTLPITYVWQATGQVPVTHTTSQLTDAITYTWNITGPQLITVTASNALNTVTATHVFTVTNLFVDSGISLTDIYEGDLAWGDYDADGDLDIVASGNTTTTAWTTTIFRNNRSNSFSVGASLMGMRNGDVEWGDYDRDGRLDLFVSGYNFGSYRAKIYQNAGSSTFLDIPTTLPYLGLSAADWGDFDNDGDLDLAVSGDTTMLPPIVTKIYENKGGTFVDSQIALPGVYNGSVEWGDYDNDGDLDLLLTGYDGGGPTTKLYRNLGQRVFEDANLWLPGVQEGGAVWGDYDNDGDLDILLSGHTGVAYIGRVYRNDGGGNFSDSGASLVGASGVTGAWGDYDNDGDLDIVLGSNLYRNDGAGDFTSVASNLPAFDRGAIAWGDYDNDGSLDLLFAGYLSPTSWATRIYRNDISSLNTPPIAPTGLGSVVNGSQITLHWNNGIDGQTPDSGLTYNLRVGTTPGGSQVAAPMALNNGYRLIPQVGNTQHGLTATLNITVPGIYYWSIQAIDTAFAGSAFANEAAFAISAPTPPASVTVTGPVSGVVNTAYTFTVTVVPTDTQTPVTYTWAATGQVPLTHVGLLSDTASFTWSSVQTGTKIITVTAANASGTVTDTHAIFIDAPSTGIIALTSLALTGPTAGTPNTLYTFVATAGPITASQPITYLWQNSNQPAIQHVGGLSDTVGWSWATAGTQTITVTAINPGGMVSRTHTLALTGPPADGDAFEPDDICGQAQVISTNGTVQSHTFHQLADHDWIVFDAISGTTYLIDAQVPLGSPANMALEIYDQCAGPSLEDQNYTFSSDVRLQFVAPATGPLYLKFFNDQPTVYGPQVGYLASVRELATSPLPGAVILVAGRLRANDPLQPNIHAVTNAAYQFFSTVGYTSTRIQYLATNSSLPGYDYAATTQHLQEAITIWALDKVDAERSLTLYLVDHGDYDKLFLDALSGQWSTPQQLDDWLDQLEAARPGVPINIIIEACKSGSFIDWAYSISGPNRVIISSTSAQNLAWASDTGALFSDHLINALARGDSLFAGFHNARSAVLASQPYQFPWLDDNGDGFPNGLQDGQAAQLRSFITVNTFGSDEWPPYILNAAGPVSIANHSGVLQANVVDDLASGVRRVWAVIYPPSYQPPQTSEDLVSEPLPTVVLLKQGGDSYATTYTGFDEVGVYRVVIHAEDTSGVEARPITIEVRAGWKVFLPVSTKM